MLEVLLKIKTKVICIVDGKEECYLDGLSAYDKLKNKYSIISISTRGNDLIFELQSLSDDTNWKDDYKQQFGSDPSFFNGRGFYQ